MGQRRQLQQFGGSTAHEVSAPQRAGDKTAAVMVMRLCSFSRMDDDFREESLLGVQTHGVPQTTYM